MLVHENEPVWIATAAERSVLGAIVLDGITAMESCIRLQPEHFALSSHQTIFKICRKLLSEHQKLDELALRDALGSDLYDVGGFPYLLSLSEGVYKRFDITQRIDTILEKWKLRRGRGICSAFQARFEAGEPSAETLAELQASVFDAIQESTEHDDPHVSAYSNTAFDDLMERCYGIEESGLTFGLSLLDDKVGRMQPGLMTVIGARSGVGKTSLMRQAAIANAGAGVPVVLFSLEASRQQVLEDIWATVSGVESKKVTRPKTLMPGDRAALKAAKDQVKQWPLRIYDRADLNINQIVAFARMNVRQHGAKLVAVDYAQSVEAEGKDERVKVMAVSKKLTKMAKSEGCHVMLLSQLRKATLAEYASPPSAADLRETTQLENDALTIVLLHRPWDKESCRISDDVSLIVPKSRRGKTGAWPATFNPGNLCFEPRPS